MIRAYFWLRGLFSEGDDEAEDLFGLDLPSQKGASLMHGNIEGLYMGVRSAQCMRSAKSRAFSRSKWIENTVPVNYCKI